MSLNSIVICSYQHVHTHSLLSVPLESVCQSMDFIGTLLLIFWSDFLCPKMSFRIPKLYLQKVRVPFSNIKRTRYFRYSYEKTRGTEMILFLIKSSFA